MQSLKDPWENSQMASHDKFHIFIKVSDIKNVKNGVFLFDNIRFIN